METGFPLVMLLGPLVAATIALVLRGRRRAVVVVGLIATTVLWLLLWLAAPGAGLFADNSVAFYGREVELTPFARSLFLFIYPALSVLFIVHWFRPAGRMLVPAGLAILSPLAAGLMVSPAGLGATFIIVAAAFVVPALHNGRYEAAAVTWRYFLMTTMALGAVLLTASFPAGGTASVNWIGPLLASLILLGGFPFYIWVTGLGRESPPAALALVLGLVQIIMVVLVLNLLDGSPAARASIEFQTAIQWSAALTALVAVFHMSRAAGWDGLVAGVTLFDMSFLLLAMLVPGAGGLMIALPALISRYLSLLLITLGLNRTPPGLGSTRSLRWRALFQPAVLAYSCLSLIGLPLTPGFTGRWAQLEVAGQGASIWPPALLVLALALGTFITFRATPRLIRIGGTPNERDSAFSLGEIIFITTLLAASVALGLFPDLAINYASRMLGLG